MLFEPSTALCVANYAMNLPPYSTYTLPQDILLSSIMRQGLGEIASVT